MDFLLTSTAQVPLVCCPNLVPQRVLSLLTETGIGKTISYIVDHMIPVSGNLPFTICYQVHNIILPLVAQCIFTGKWHEKKTEQ
jgi:hypothetical protein